MKLSGQEPFISKSKFLSGLQCHKLLWHSFNATELLPETDAATEAIFEQGREVGALPQQMFLDGVEIGGGIYDYDETTRLTQKALKLSKRLFEAAFAANSGFCRWTLSSQRRETPGTLSRSSPRPASRTFIWKTDANFWPVRE